MRAANEPMVDQADIAEATKTQHVLHNGTLSLFGALAWCLINHPARLLKAILVTVRQGRRSNVGVFRHFIYLIEACFVANLCIKDGSQHLHAHFGTNATSVAMLAALLCNRPYSFTVHGPEEFDAPHALSLGEKIEKAAFTVAISQFGRSQLCRWVVPQFWDKIKVVHCGIEPDAFAAPKPMPTGPLKLVSIGRFAEQKGHVSLIEGFANALRDQPDMQLVLIGDGEMRPAISQSIQSHGITDSVALTGWLDEKDIAQHLGQAHVMILPSFAEGLPMVIMEAMASGRPVISTYVAGIPELVLPGESGWLVPAGDAARLAQAILDCARIDRDRLQNMGEMARERVLQRHDIDVLAGQLSDHFQQG